MMTAKNKLEERLGWLGDNYDMSEDERKSICRAMIEFARYHVEEAKKEIAENAEVKIEHSYGSKFDPNQDTLPVMSREYDVTRYGHGDSTTQRFTVYKKGIMESYPLDNIK